MQNQSACRRLRLNPAATVCSVVNTTNTECKDEKREGVTMADPPPPPPPHTTVSPHSGVGRVGTRCVTETNTSSERESGTRTGP